MGPRHFAGSVSVGTRFHRHPFGRYPFFGWGAPYFYADDYGPDEVEYREEPRPQPSPQPQIEAAQPVGDPVLLELHGNQWVKVSNFGEQAGPTSNSDNELASVKAMPPAVLVFRDGHNEEISSYSIIGRVMYTKGDYYASGSWTRTIQLADLDLPATLKKNHELGVKFDLPSGPDEVIVRP